ncbi:hypothetical protein [Psychrobacter okhotskensis]|uniref:hypothetical protein n=1 Tax=Psychrobacter okhotskensis TaxID=212403 RepID=UPI00191955A5|nr:hypothetical protein [Psychrobacter okhotskensis]
MNRFIVIVCFFIGLLLLASLLWLKRTGNLSTHSLNIDQQLSENVAEATSTNIEGANSQIIDRTFPRKQFQPKTDWSDKTMDFNGTQLSYKFGEGNPSEVALLPEHYLPRKGSEGMPYLTAKTEYLLKAFLSDKNLPQLLNKCVNYLNDNMAAQNPDIPVNQMVSVLDNKDVDIENYLIIDKETGRKMINPKSDYRMNDFLNTLNNPLSRSPIAIECFELNRMQDFEELQRKFHVLGREYTHTGKVMPE